MGNAAALDVYAFLSLSDGEKTLLQAILEDDAALGAAISSEPAEAEALMATFRQFYNGEGVPETDTLMRQIYFPLPDGSYHLLAPLFPSSFAQAVYERLREARFGETNKAAREAKKENKPFTYGYEEYPSLLVQKFGGTMSQNISRFNIERQGENWLLSSCPPQWKSAAVKLPLNTESVFKNFLFRIPGVNPAIRETQSFLEKTDYNNLAIRERRAELVDNIITAVLQWAASVQAQEGWSAVSECRLLDVERCWLDSAYAAQDEFLAPMFKAGEWKGEICSRFAKWLNAALRTDSLPMGSSEYGQWKRDIKDALDSFGEDIADV